MAFLIQNLIEPVQLTTVATTYYQSPALTRTRVDAIAVVNSDPANPYVVTIHWVPAGQIASAQNIVVNAQTIGAGAAWLVYPMMGQTLAPGDYIQALADVSLQLNFMASGLVMNP